MTEKGYEKRVFVWLVLLLIACIERNVFFEVVFIVFLNNVIDFNSGLFFK